MLQVLQFVHAWMDASGRSDLPNQLRERPASARLDVMDSINTMGDR